MNEQPELIYENAIQQTTPADSESQFCRTLRSQFPFMWKICLIYGVCYVLLAYQNLNGIGSGIFAGVNAAFLLLIVKRLKEHPEKNPESFTIAITPLSIFYLVSAVLISFGNCITDNSFFLFFNHVGSFLLFSIGCIKLFYNDRQWDFGKYTAILFSFWIQVLVVLPVPFQDYNFFRKKSKKKLSLTTRYIIIGILAGFPILLVTTLLLASADKIFSSLLVNMFHFENTLGWIFEKLPENIILLPCGFIIYTLLLYLVIASLCKAEFKTDTKKPAQFGTAIAVTIFVMIDIVYLLFSCIQFLFLFAGLPAQFDYAQYARQGFFELLFVSLINFFLVLFCNKHFAKNTALKITMTVTCFCTFVMIVSSAYRMLMYIDVYHLTFLRVFVLWFLCMLSLFMIGSTISIYNENWNSFRYCLFVLTCFYTGFALSNIDTHIARYNVKQYEQNLLAYTNGTSSDAPRLYHYLPDGYENSMAYADALAGLYTSYYDRIHDSDYNGSGAKTGSAEMIENYFSIENFFYNYNFYGDYGLDEISDIYDKEQASNIFLWKHYNFMEANCYHKCKMMGK